MPINANIKVGTLIQSDSHIGVIRYIGPVNELKDNTEIWYGIEWKDPNRGKHDGSFKGARYFQTKYPTSGSFVRPTKVDFGVDIKTAIVEKYLEVEEIENGEEKVLYNNFDVENKELMINCVVLAYSKINRVDSLEFLASTFPYMKELDLEGNLLESWFQVFTILEHLKGLKLINLSNNFLSLPESCSKFAFDEKNVYPNIQHLIINRMNYTWADIERVLVHFPNLIELKVCFNVIAKIKKVDASLLRSLKVLDLESNKSIVWDDLKKFGNLIELETLYANDLNVSSIEFTETAYGSKSELFPKLKLLSVTDNKLSQWQSINELTKLANLVELTMKFNPLNGTDSLENIRQFVIAKMPDLKVFNRTQIMHGERKGSEIDYLKKFGQEWLDLEAPEKSCEENKNEFLLLHPSYIKLIEKYGAAEKSEVYVTEDTIKATLIWINIKDESSGVVKRKKLSLTSDLQRLKLIFLRLFKYKNSDSRGISLLYMTERCPGDEFPLDNEMRTLDFFAISNEDTIILRRNRYYKLDD